MGGGDGSGFPEEGVVVGEEGEDEAKEEGGCCVDTDISWWVVIVVVVWIEVEGETYGLRSLVLGRRFEAWLRLW